MSSVRLKHRKKVCTHLHGLLNTLTQARGAGEEVGGQNIGSTEKHWRGNKRWRRRRRKGQRVSQW